MGGGRLWVVGGGCEWEACIDVFVCFTRSQTPLIHFPSIRLVTRYRHFAAQAVTLMRNASRSSAKFAENNSSITGGAGSWFDARDVGTPYRLPPQHLTHSVVFVPRNLNMHNNEGGGGAAIDARTVQSPSPVKPIRSKKGKLAPAKSRRFKRTNSMDGSASKNASKGATVQAGNSMLTREMSRVMVRSSSFSGQLPKSVRVLGMPSARLTRSKSVGSAPIKGGKGKKGGKGGTGGKNNGKAVSFGGEMTTAAFGNLDAIFDARANEGKEERKAEAKEGDTAEAAPSSTALVSVDDKENEETAIDILFAGLESKEMNDEDDDDYDDSRPRSRSRSMSRGRSTSQPKRNSVSKATGTRMARRQSTYMSDADKVQQQKEDALDIVPGCGDNWTDLLQQHYVTSIFWQRDKWLTRPQRIAILFVALFTKMLLTSFLFELKQFSQIDNLINNFTPLALLNYVAATVITIVGSSLVHRVIMKLHQFEAKLRRKVDVLTMRDFLAFGEPPKNSYQERAFFE